MSVLKIGLTGGICSGKSTVSSLFAELGVLVIDSDQINNSLLQDNEFILKTIINHFGPIIITHSGQLNRTELRKIIFKNSTERRWLEALLHPYIVAEINRQVSVLKDTSYCIIVIPLLAELVSTQQLIDHILVVDVPESLQIKRLMIRDHITEQEAQSILSAQANRNDRLNIADDIILNESDEATLSQTVLDLHEQYKKIACAKK